MFMDNWALGLKKLSVAEHTQKSLIPPENTGKYYS
jgi:hypothetical protein